MSLCTLTLDSQLRILLWRASNLNGASHRIAGVHGSSVVNDIDSDAIMEQGRRNHRGPIESLSCVGGLPLECVCLCVTSSSIAEQHRQRAVQSVKWKAGDNEGESQSVYIDREGGSVSHV